MIMKQSMVLLAVLFALAVAHRAALADMTEPSQKPQSPSFEAGRKAVEAKDFKSALAHLAKAAQETPNDADVQNLLGYSYRKTGQFDKAMEHYRLALKIDPGHRGAHEYLGELFLETDRLADAEKELQALSKACPWFGKCEEREDLKEAIEKYKAKKK
jgi:Flp pilus assembly protein TadD